ncbi:MAG: PAS domain S-box protein [Ilumatobacteraceae bacterium]
MEQRAGAAPMSMAAIVDSLPDCVLVIDTAGLVRFANRAAEVQLGYRLQDWVDRSLLEMVHPDDVASVVSSMETVQGKAVGTPVEVRVRDASGGWHWFEEVGTNVTLDDGHPAILVVARDITQRRMWEVAANDTARFQQVVQVAPGITLLLDARGVVTSVNAAFTRMLGHDQSKVLGRSFISFVAEGDVHAAQLAFDRLLAGATSVSFETRMTMSGQAELTRPVRFEMVSHLTDPVVAGIVVSGYDVSELVVVREQLEDAAAILNSLPDRVSRYRVGDHVVTYCNAAWAEQYKVPASEAVGRTLDGFLSADELEGLHVQLACLGPQSSVLVDPVARTRPNTPGQWVQWVDRLVVDANGGQIVSIGRDVTDRHVAEQLLAESEARFRDLADRSADVVWRFVVEPVPHLDYISPSVENILGYPPSYFLEDFTRMLAILDDAGTTAIDRALRGERVFDRIDFRFRHANGSIVVGETRTTTIPGGLQGVSRDVTELRQLQKDATDLALRDSLTGLASRRLFDELLGLKLAQTKRSGQPAAVAFLDLDGFKNVNDTYGHSAGDVVLRETARRLTSVVRGADTVARLGGDEFVIIYEPNETTSYDLVQRVESALAAPILLTPTISVSCPVSIGNADTGLVGYNAAALLNAADQAMYAAKRTRRSALAPPTDSLGVTAPTPPAVRTDTARAVET